MQRLSLLVLVASFYAATVAGFSPVTPTPFVSRTTTPFTNPATFQCIPQLITPPTCQTRQTMKTTSTALAMASEEGGSKSNLPFWLDIGTKGGAVFWSLVLFIVPIIGYNIVTGVFGVDEIEAGKWIGVGFTAVAMLAWGSTYLFRVATKDMTYVSSRAAIRFETIRSKNIV